MSEQDITKNRHGGNEQSTAAFEEIRESLPKRRSDVLVMIQKAGLKGLTVHEAAKLAGTTPNTLSGRFSELKRDGLITKRGTRPTVSGCKAGVFVAFKNVSPPVPGPPAEYWHDLFQEIYEPNPYDGTAGE